MLLLYFLLALFCLLLVIGVVSTIVASAKDENFFLVTIICAIRLIALSVAIGVRLEAIDAGQIPTVVQPRR